MPRLYVYSIQTLMPHMEVVDLDGIPVRTLPRITRHSITRLIRQQAQLSVDSRGVYRESFEALVKA